MKQGANNINLVTGTQFVPQIIESITIAKKRGLNLPIIYNTSGYEKVETLRMLEGFIDVYLPDFKYMSNDLALRYSHSSDYPLVTMAAIDEMFRQCPKLNFDDNGFITKGLIVRNLLLPGHVNESKAVIKYLFEHYGNSIYISIMSQYTPMKNLSDFPEINRRVTKREYESLVDYAIELGIENAFIQDRKVAKESFIPDFNGEGV